MNGHVSTHPTSHPENSPLTLKGTEINFPDYSKLRLWFKSMHLHTIVLCVFI